MKSTAYEIARTCKYDRYQKPSASINYKFFNKKIGLGMRVNLNLAEELDKPVIEKYKRWKTYEIFKEWVQCLKDKKGKTVLNTFIKTVNESNGKPNKLCVDEGRELYSKCLREERLDNNDILMYSTHNEDTSVITERITKTLKSKI